MPIFEWEGLVRITVGSLTRASQLDLWRNYTESELYSQDGERTGLDNTRHIMETDAMVTVASTRKIEVCVNGEWQELKKKTVIEHDGDVLELSYPPTPEMINSLPIGLSNQWIEAAVSKNGGLTANLTFFSSLTLKSGKVNSADKSE